MSKQDTRNQLNSDVEAFLKSGGKITHAKSTKTPKRKMTANGSQKPFFSWAEPKNRPSTAWDGIVTID